MRWVSLVHGFVVKEPDFAALCNVLTHLPKDRFEANITWILVLSFSPWFLFIYFLPWLSCVLVHVGIGAKNAESWKLWDPSDFFIYFFFLSGFILKNNQPTTTIKPTHIKIPVFLQNMSRPKLCCLLVQICFLLCMVSLLLPLESAGSRSSMACPSWFAAACCLQRFVRRTAGTLPRSSSSSSVYPLSDACILKQTSKKKNRQRNGQGRQPPITWQGKEELNNPESDN